jgi:hypothetical protein
MVWTKASWKTQGEVLNEPRLVYISPERWPDVKALTNMCESPGEQILREEERFAFDLKTRRTARYEKW